MGPPLNSFICSSKTCLITRTSTVPIAQKFARTATIATSLALALLGFQGCWIVMAVSFSSRDSFFLKLTEIKFGLVRWTAPRYCSMQQVQASPWGDMKISSPLPPLGQMLQMGTQLMYSRFFPLLKWRDGAIAWGIKQETEEERKVCKRSCFRGMGYKRASSGHKWHSTLAL